MQHVWYLIKKINRHKKEENVTYNKEKNQSIETDPENIVMVDLEGKRAFQSWFKHSAYAQGHKRKHKHYEKNNERWKYFDGTKEARDTTNTLKWIRWEDNLILLFHCCTQKLVLSWLRMICTPSLLYKWEKHTTILFEAVRYCWVLLNSPVLMFFKC